MTYRLESGSTSTRPSASPSCSIGAASRRAPGGRPAKAARRMVHRPGVTIRPPAFGSDVTSSRPRPAGDTSCMHADDRQVLLPTDPTTISTPSTARFTVGADAARLPANRRDRGRRPRRGRRGRVRPDERGAAWTYGPAPPRASGTVDRRLSGTVHGSFGRPVRVPGTSARRCRRTTTRTLRRSSSASSAASRQVDAAGNQPLEPRSTAT